MAKRRKTFELISAEKRQAKAQMFFPASSLLGVTRPAATDAAPATPAPGTHSLQAGDESQNFQTLDDVTPKDGDFIYPTFRALSQTIIEGHWLDFSKPGVLEAAVPMLTGQTVFKNHVFWRVEDSLGVVKNASWDAKGANSQGIPGINAELMIDWKMNPRIARGLMMRPPAIHSASVTVLFEFDFSHPKLVEERRFWSLLGEEVEGEIVRLIITKILKFWEISLVFQGADVYAKQLPPQSDEVDVEEDDETELSAYIRNLDAAGTPIVEEKQTVKLTLEQKKSLGLESFEGEDVPEAIVLSALGKLAALAVAGQVLLDAQKVECLRVATLCEGDKEGKLPGAIEELINSAAPGQLDALSKLYTERAGLKFPPTCQKCGAQSSMTRSSVEPPAEGQTAAVKPTVGGFLH